MFNVGRFDPRKEASSSKRSNSKTEKGKKGKRRRRSGSDEKRSHEKDADLPPPDSSLHVIAPEAKGPVSVQRKSGRIEEEAFDDMELDAREVPVAREAQEEERNDEKFDKSPNERAPAKKSKERTDPTSGPMADVSDEIRNAIHMASLPIREAADRWDLAPFLVDNLEREGFEHFFPIQALVIPDIIASERYSYIRAQDVCVSASTGSGKTLAFVIPILNALSKRKVKRLRALVVLPSRDLGT